ncbi:MAG: family 43 glycosylhydrolase, partial [Oscillospiraceae bacterium]|nr:family 43 glycosylhydrolase [Oscillospiraceae bacterium]
MDLKKLTAALTAILCCLTAGAAMPAVRVPAHAESTVANPFIWSDVPDDDVIRVGDTYYMVSTTMFFTPGVPIMKSKDMVSWELCGYVYDTYADGNKQNLVGNEHDYAHGQWATSLRYKDGTFYVFFGSYGTGKSYIYKTNDIESGNWTRTELNGMYHDASMMLDADGRNYLVYGGGGEIKIKEFNAEMTGFKQGGLDKTIFKTGLDNLAGEGSHIQKIGDYYYVFVIAWPSRHGRLELCYRSKNIAGPYEGRTILDSGLGTYGSGVAQGGIVDTPDGRWYGLMFQDHGAVGRIPVLVPVNWQDGWPMLGVNGKAPTTFTVPDDYKGTFLAKDDEFNYSSNKLALEWQWNHNPDNKAWSVTEREGYLRLHNEHTAKSILHARNTLTMRTEGPACSSVIKLETDGMKPGDHAGLSAFQFNYGNVGVRVDDSGRKTIYMAKNGAYGGNSQVMDSYDKIIQEVPLNGNTAYLKVEFTFNTVDGNFNVSNNIDKANFFYSTDGTNWTKIGDTLGMTYDLKLFTGYRSAIYSYATKSTGGYADIDYFDYERADWNLPVIVEPDANGYYFRDTFEGSSDKWEGRGAAKIAVTSDVKFEGNSSLAVTDRTSAWNGTYKRLNSSAFKAGESYSFSANAMCNDGDSSPETFHLTLQYDGADGEAHYDKVDTQTVPKGEWVQLSNPSYLIPEGAKNL